jgi:hypothetical protein
MSKTMLFIAALALISATEGHAREGVGGKVEWSSDLESSLEVARRGGRPLMLYFTHDD